MDSYVLSVSGIFPISVFIWQIISSAANLTLLKKEPALSLWILKKNLKKITIVE